MERKIDQQFNFKDILLSLHGSIESSNTSDFVKTSMAEYCESWNTGDLEKRKSLFDESATFSDPKNANVIEGIEAIYGFWLSTNEMPGSFKTQIHSTVACGDNGVLDFTINFHNPDDSIINLKVREVFTFNASGKITAVEAYWDEGSIT